MGTVIGEDVGSLIRVKLSTKTIYVEISSSIIARNEYHISIESVVINA